MDDIVLQRITAIMAKKNISVLSLAKVLNMHDTTLNRQLKGQSAMSGSTILAIILHFDDISAEWLLRGEGEMFRENSGEISQNSTATDQSLLAEKDQRISELKDTIAILKSHVALLEQNQKTSAQTFNANAG